jgi:hypothetical protein
VQYLTIAIHSESQLPLVVARDDAGLLWLCQFRECPPLTGELNPVSPRQIFQCFQGGYYDLLGEAKDAESSDPYILYRSIESGKGQDTWTCPRSSFFSKVEIDGVKIPRFKRWEPVIGQKFRHFKSGTIYELIAIARDHESQQALAVYQNVATGACWVRPYLEFLEEIDHQGKRIMRFTPVNLAG